MLRKSYSGFKFVKMQVSAIVCSVLMIGLLTACGDSENSTAATNNVSPATVSSNSSTAVSAESKEASQEEASGERTVIDELGHELVIPASPQNVYAPYLEDSLLKLGVKPVAQWANGNQVHAYLQDQLKDIPLSDLSSGLPSPEVVMSYKPDLIILHTESFAKDYENYSKIAPAYVFKNASGNVEKSLSTLGDLLDKTAEAEKALQDYKEKVKISKEKLDQAAAGKKVAIIRFAGKGVSLMGKNYLCGYVVHQDLGVGNSKLVDTENSFNISQEILPDLDADYIFIINQYGQGTERLKEMTDSPIWQSIPAVKNGKVNEVDAGYWLGGGLIAYEKIIDDTVKFLTEE
ncbi:putative siderophore-binding lipoprotein YfiY precursor [compost metagenome]